MPALNGLYLSTSPYNFQTLSMVEVIHGVEKPNVIKLAPVICPLRSHILELQDLVLIRLRKPNEQTVLYVIIVLSACIQILSINQPNRTKSRTVILSKIPISYILSKVLDPNDKLRLVL